MKASRVRHHRLGGVQIFDLLWLDATSYLALYFHVVKLIV